MASIYEQVMNACLESKRAAKDAAKKTVKKTVVESKMTKKATKKSLKESDEIDDTAIDDVDDAELTDVADDIMVVVDPELDPEENDTAAEAQDIIDGTPEGEIPTTDEYIGDYTYTCPICGNTFFSETEMNDGDECPVCGEFPDGYVLVGQVESTEDATDEEIPEDEEDLEVDTPEEDLEPIDAEESVKKTETKYSGYTLDESTFNPFLTKFIKENYKNAKSFGIVGATKKGSKLELECKLVFKSGKTRDVVLTVENFKPSKNMTMAAKEDGTFKVESKKATVAPFVFESVMTPGRVIKCTGMKYNFITSVTEGKKARVSGKLVRESKKTNFQKRK